MSAFCFLDVSIEILRFHSLGYQTLEQKFKCLISKRVMAIYFANLCFCFLILFVVVEDKN